MSGQLRLIRDPKLTMATLVDELLPLREGRVVSYECTSPEGDDPQPRESLFSDLFREVAAMSRFLVEATGLQRGGRVAICQTNDQRYFRWILAVVRAGGIAVPLNPQLSLAEIGRIVARCEVSSLVTDQEVFAAKVQSRDALPVPCWIQSGEGESLDGFQRFSGDWLDASPLPPAQISPRDTVAVFHTSGTEGFPKGAMLSSETLLAGRALALFAAPLVGRKALALLSLPWSHIMGASTAIYGLLAGVPGFLLPRFDTQRVISVIERYRVTTVIGVPAMFIRLLNASPDPKSLSSVRLWVSASDHLPAAYRRRLLQYGALLGGPGPLRIGSLFINAYGMVELGGVAMFGLDASFLPGRGEFCLPVPPHQVRVADEFGRKSRPNETGECQVRGPGISGRYWGDSESGTSNMVTGGWLRTGDLATRNRFGFVRLTGRSKDVIKHGGYSVFAREVEEALASHPSVVRAAVIGIPHDEKGEVPVAVVECLPGSTQEEDALLAWCKQRLAAYKVPRAVHIVAPGGLPQGVTEKVLKTVLRQRFASESQALAAKGGY